MFSDLVVPCIDELLVNIAKDETYDQVATFNTIRLDCNTQTLGYSQREFKFHDLEMSQVDKVDAFDIPTVEYFTNAAIGLFRKIVYGDDEEGQRASSFKNFNESPMF